MSPKVYKQKKTDKIAYPLGGFGAGMFCLSGEGMYRAFSLRNEPNLTKNPNIFASVTLKRKDGENISRVLEGQVGYSKVFGYASPGPDYSPGNGMSLANFGLPRFEKCTFTSKFPFASIKLGDSSLPFSASIEGFSPFIPSSPDDSSLPVASVKYTFKNSSDEPLDLVFYFSSMNFMEHAWEHEAFEARYTESIPNGFMFTEKALPQKPYTRGDFAVTLDKCANVNTDFFRGGWWDPFTILWKEIQNAATPSKSADDNKSPGASLSHAFTLKPKSSYSVSVRFAWYVPDTFLRFGHNLDNDADDIAKGRPCHRPWYADKFDSARAVMRYYRKNHARLYRETKKFSDALYKSTLPLEILDAVTSNLSILKSPTVLRQTNGDMWAWEGCTDLWGSCHGSCTHVWNYAQAICHLFPSLERSLRFTEFNVSQDERGHQQFRSSLPIRPVGHDFHAASDGQLGGIMKLYREWRISGDDNFILSLYDKMISSIEYCIRTWDPDGIGVLMEPHHNTYDIEFWGADGMCSSFYLGALKAVTLIGEHFGYDVKRYSELYSKGKEYLETVLFNGEYFYQIPEWKTLHAEFNIENEYKESKGILEAEGPKYQYGNGCISDGVLGAWLAKICGLGDILDREKVISHLLSIHKYNLKKDLRQHSNTQRPGYALGAEGGLLLCSWPHGGKPSLPFVYSDEVWTGIEYQVASHLALYGYKDEALDIVTTLRERYDGEKRNPFDEYECGHWYARALASYSLIEAFTLVSYDKRSRTLTVGKSDKPYKAFLAFDGGYTVVCYNNGEVTLEDTSGSIEIESIVTAVN